jgi:hypothetical protein
VELDMRVLSVGDPRSGSGLRVPQYFTIALTGAHRVTRSGVRSAAWQT